MIKPDNSQEKDIKKSRSGFAERAEERKQDFLLNHYSFHK
ncbi:MAG: hypothetical protein ACJA02_000843 [Myxococcota bacterium]|jgi:hypothetical protein